MARVRSWDPQAVELAKELATGAYARVDDALHAVRDPDLRLDLIESLAGGASSKQLDGWRAALPESEHAAIARAIRTIDDAWDERNYAEGDELSEAQLETFLGTLREAEELLRLARRVAPNDPVPYAIAIRLHRSATNLQELKEAWKAGLALHPEFRRLYYEFLTGLSPRWYGSAEDILAFAADQSRDAPGGDFRHALIAAAHCEILATILAGQRETADFIAISREYFAQLSVRRDILHAAYATAGETRSWSHAGIRELNVLAFAMALCEQPVADLFVALDGRYTPEPWSYLGEPEEVFARFESRVFRSKRGRGVPRTDTEAADRIQAVFPMIGLPILAVWLMYLGIGEGMVAPRVDRSRPAELRVVHKIEKTSKGIRRYAVTGYIGDTYRSVSVFKDHYRALKKDDRVRVYPVRGQPGEYMAESQLRSGISLFGVRVMTVNYAFLVGAAVALLWAWLLFAPMRRRIELQ